ncbi:MAG: hypothetical protein AAFU65_00645, partial [Pseudomonadota bacterium]
MNARVIFSVLLFATGAAAGALARGAMDAPATPAASPSAPSAEDVLANVRNLPPADSEESRTVIGMLESLSIALTQEAEYRLVLEQQIDTLNNRVDELQGQMGRRAERLSDEQIKERLSTRQQRGGPLTVDKLTSAGMDDATARAFKSKVDDIALQRLYLRDQAMREGWVGDPRYREESRRLSQAQSGLRDEFGNDAYDAYLYASGRPNRIQVQNVLENSP